MGNLGPTKIGSNFQKLLQQDGTVQNATGSAVSLNIAGHITASGHISASLNSTGSFGTLRLAYDDLPTSNPSVKGAVWRDGTDLKISAG